MPLQKRLYVSSYWGFPYAGDRDKAQNSAYAKHKVYVSRINLNKLEDMVHKKKAPIVMPVVFTGASCKTMHNNGKNVQCSTLTGCPDMCCTTKGCANKAGCSNNYCKQPLVEAQKAMASLDDTTNCQLGMQKAKCEEDEIGNLTVGVQCKEYPEYKVNDASGLGDCRKVSHHTPPASPCVESDSPFPSPSI